MKYSYKAFESTGKASQGTLDAPSEADARESLRKRGVFATEITAVDADGAAQPGTNPAKARLADVAAFMREMAVLLSTGTPVVEALTSLERQVPRESLRKIIGDLRQSVQEGTPLSVAMMKYPRAFDGVICSLVRAGEEGGRLDEMLNRLSKLLRQAQRVRGALVGAMIYPVILITVAMSVLSAMIGFVLPKFQDLFKTLDAPLPSTTKALLALGAFMRGNWPGVVVGLAVLVTLIVLYLRSEAGREAVHRVLVVLPGFGKVTRAFSIARVARVLGVLLEGKVPLLDALRLTRTAVWSRAYARLVERAENAVVRGESLHAAFSSDSGSIKLVSPSVCEAVRNAERGGRLGPVFTSIADHLDEDNELVVKSLTSIVEPVILIVLGLIVGVVAISMFLPLFDLTAAGSGGGGT